jgi:hypothetical protein
MDAVDEIVHSLGTPYSPGAFADENMEDLSRFNNGAETIRLSLDVNSDGVVDEDDEYTGTPRGGDFEFLRQVNADLAETVALGVRGPLPRHDSSLPAPMFQYWGTFNNSERALWGDADGDGVLGQSEIEALTSVPINQLDRIREVTVTVEVLSDDERRTDAEREATSTILRATVRPRNIGMNANDLSACGQPPQPPRNIVAIDTPEDGGRSITLTFQASFDDGGGENDVKSYYVYRRRAGQSSFGAPIYKMPAEKLSSYQFINNQNNSVEADFAPVDAQPYEYYITAWDCEPQESNPSVIVGPVTSQPNGPVPPVIVDAFDTPCDSGGDITVVFSASPDEADGNFTGYRVYRGVEAGITAYKIRVLDVQADGSNSYTAHDVTTSITPLHADTTYFYVVRAVRSGIESVDSNQWGPVFVSDTIAKPHLHTVADVSGDFGTKLQIGWDPSPSEQCTSPNNVSSYAVMRRSDFAPLWLSVKTVSASGGPYSWLDSTLTPEVRYEYMIRAYTSGGSYIESNILWGRPSAENQLLPPFNVVAADLACDPNGWISLTWDASSSDLTGNATHYRIYRGTQPGVYDTELPMVSATGDPHYAIQDDSETSGASAPVLGVTYYYVMRTYNDYYGLESSDSNVCSVTSQSTPVPPFISSAGDTPNDSGRSITVHFLPSDQDGPCDATVTTYRIYRGTNPSVTNVHVGSVTAVQATSYTFVDDLVHSYSPPQDDVQYYYAARAFVNEMSSGLSNVVGPAVAMQDVQTLQVVFEDDFESWTGWSHGGDRDDWERSSPQGGDPYYGNPDPTSATSGSRVYGNSLGGSGSYDRDADCWLRSPPIDCRSISNVQLRFKRWLNVERPERDQADIEIRWAGQSSYVRVWRNPAEVTDNSWTQFEIDLSQWVDGKDGVYIRFRLRSNSSRQYTGWNIDDVQVVGD